MTAPLVQTIEDMYDSKSGVLQKSHKMFLSDSECGLRYRKKIFVFPVTF